ncbi:MAG: FHIPEP family type III secretion protein, partial [Pseudomonadota bacterium]
RELGWDDIPPVDALGLEVGYRLIPIVDAAQDGKLLARIRGVRKKLSQELGFLVPTVHIRDNLDLLPNGYRIALQGVTLAEAEIHPDRLLAIDPGEVFGKLEGLAAREPAFGMEAVWIEPEQKENAETLGYTVVDPSTVVATHLNQLMQTHAAELLGHEEVQRLIDQLAIASPRLAEQLVPDHLSIAEIHQVLQQLLLEQIPIRDIRTIAEALLADGGEGKPTELRLAAVRTALGRMIVHSIYGTSEALDVITLEPELEGLLLKAKQNEGQGPVFEPGMAERLQQSFRSVADQQEVAGKPTVLLVSGAIRQLLARFVRFSQRAIHVLAYEEIPQNKQVSVVSTIGKGAPA